MRPFTSFAMFATLAAFGGLPACTTEAASAAGTYSATVDTTGMPEDQAKALAGMMKLSDLVLHADGTWEMSMEMDMMGAKSKHSSKGTWKLEGGEMVMTKTEDDGKKADEPDTRKGAYKDGAFSITIDDGPMTMKMDFKKK